jgi:hypothetical protein
MVAKYPFGMAKERPKYYSYLPTSKVNTREKSVCPAKATDFSPAQPNRYGTDEVK